LFFEKWGRSGFDGEVFGLDGSGVMSLNIKNK